MPVLRLEAIPRNLHFNNKLSGNSERWTKYDRLYKVWPLITYFNKQFLSVPKLQRLCMDGKMCATKMAGTHLLQYMAKKTHKCRFKLFNLCDSAGFSYVFEIYSGAGDNTILDGIPDLGSGKFHFGSRSF